MSYSPRPMVPPLPHRHSSNSSQNYSPTSTNATLSIPRTASPSGLSTAPSSLAMGGRNGSATSDKSITKNGQLNRSASGRDEIDRLGYLYSLRIALLHQHITAPPPPPLPHGASASFLNTPPNSYPSPSGHGTSPNGPRFSFSALSPHAPNNYSPQPSPTYPSPGLERADSNEATSPRPLSTRRKSFFSTKSKDENEGSKLPKEFLLEFWSTMAEEKGDPSWEIAVSQFLNLIGSGKKGTRTPSGLNLREIPTFLEAFTSTLPPPSSVNAAPHIHQSHLLNLLYSSLPTSTYFSPVARTQTEKDRDLLFRLRAEVQSYMLSSPTDTGNNDFSTSGLGMGMRMNTSPGRRKSPPTLGLGRTHSQHSEDGGRRKPSPSWAGDSLGAMTETVGVVWGIGIDILERDAAAIKAQGLDKDIKRSLSALSSLPTPLSTVQRTRQAQLAQTLTNLLVTFPDLSMPGSPGDFGTSDQSPGTEYFVPPQSKKTEVFARLAKRAAETAGHGPKARDLVEKCREMWVIGSKRDKERELEATISRWESSLGTSSEMDWGTRVTEAIRELSFSLIPSDPLPPVVVKLGENLLAMVNISLPSIFPTTSSPPPGPPPSVLPILRSAPDFFLSSTQAKRVLAESADELRAGAVGEYVGAAGEFIGGVGMEVSHGGRGENGKDLTVEGFEKLAQWIESEIKNVKKVWKEGVGSVLDPAAIIVSKQLPLFLAELQVLERHRHTGTDIFPLYESTARLLSYWEEACPDQEHGFDLDAFFEPHVTAWLRDTAETNTHEWVSRAVGMDSWVPEGENKHSQSVIDLFAFIRETVQVVLHDLPLGEYKRAVYIIDLSKTISNAVTQYASTVQALFASDLSPVKPGTQSEIQTQLQNQLGGKASAWLAKGKQAVKNLEKKKIDGFIIPPTACVKLTDMGAAQISLEDLLVAMEAEETARIIKEHKIPNGNHLSVDRSARNVFSVTVMRGENLLAKGLNKAADGFVVVVDKESGERLLKTRTVLGAEDPRWEETFEISIGTLKTLELTCFDRLLVGKHDQIGSATFRLDPKSFTTVTTRDVILPLSPRGLIRLRISMEGGEQHDVHFHLLTAHRALERASHDMQRDILDRMGEYIKHVLSVGTLQALTRPLKDKKKGKVALSEQDVEASLWPLLEYFNENFSVFSVTLLVDQRLSLMLQIWRRLIDILISLLVPPLSDKPVSSTHSTLSAMEIDIIFKWLQLLKTFFNAKENDGVEHGIPMSQLQGGAYRDIVVLGQYMDLPTLQLKEKVIAAVKAAGRGASGGTNGSGGIVGGMRGMGLSAKSGDDEDERLAEVLLRIARTRSDTSDFLAHQVQLLTRARMERQGAII